MSYTFFSVLLKKICMFVCVCVCAHVYSLSYFVLLQEVLRSCGLGSNFYFLFSFTSLLWAHLLVQLWYRVIRWSYTDLMYIALCMLLVMITTYALIPIFTQLSTSSSFLGAFPQEADLDQPPWIFTSSSFMFLCVFLTYEFVLGDVLLCWWCTHSLSLLYLNISVKKMLNYLIQTWIHVQNAGKQWNCDKMILGNSLMWYK